MLLERGYLSKLWDLPGFAFTMIILDLMHVSDLGICQYLLGNVIYELFKQMGGLVTNPEPVMGKLLKMIKDAAKLPELKIQAPVNKLTLSMVRRQGTDPKLRTKASETRRMLYVVDYLLDKEFPADTDHERDRKACVWNLAEFYRELEKWEKGGFSASRCAALGRTHVNIYTQLSRDHRHLVELWGFHAYKFYPKHHLFIHLIEDGIFYADNPRDVWAYADESAIGDAVEVAESCNPLYIIRNVIEKQRL